MTRATALAALGAVVLAVTGCAGSPPVREPSDGAATDGGYYQNDGPPADQEIDIASIPEAVPVDEPLSKYGNPASYEALGQTYYVLKSASGFTQTGRASWYGRQFHGRRTSSGEPYSMFKMTAAHKRLPIPSYVRVTRLDTGKHIIVRVNDRGPFHDGRIIDLSYVAARRLGIVAQGSAPVRIETVTPNSLRAEREPADPQHRDAADAPRGSGPATGVSSGHQSVTRDAQAKPVAISERSVDTQSTLYLQTGAFSEASNARRLRSRLRDAGFEHTVIAPPDPRTTLYRVRVGPFDSERSRDSTRRMLAHRGFAAHEVERSPGRQ